MAEITPIHENELAKEKKVKSNTEDVKWEFHNAQLADHPPYAGSKLSVLPVLA